MKIPGFRAAVGILIAVACAVAQPAAAGGAWPRGKGKFFASLAYSTYGNLVGYVQALQYNVPGVPVPDLTQEISTYAEFGLSDRLTFGLDRHGQIAEDTVSNIFFFRTNFARPGWKSSYGVEFGLGAYRDWRDIDESIMRLGLSWGRGFETRWTDGWVDVDAKVATLSSTRSVLWKVDSTFGVKPGELSLLYLQMQSGALDGYPTYTRAVPTYVRRLGHGISLESALLVGLVNDDSSGMKIGAWLEF